MFAVAGGRRKRLEIIVPFRGGAQFAVDGPPLQGKIGGVGRGSRRTMVSGLLGDPFDEETRRASMLATAVASSLLDLLHHHGGDGILSVSSM